MPRPASLLATLLSVALALTAAAALPAQADQAMPAYDRSALQLSGADRDRLLGLAEEQADRSYASAARSTRASACPVGVPRSGGFDGTQLDASEYGAYYGCATAGDWYYEVLTHDSWGPSQLDDVFFAADTDGTAATGCGGFEWLVTGGWSASLGRLTAVVVSTPDCDSSLWRATAPAGIGTDGAGVALFFRHTDLGGGGSTVRWYGGIVGSAETSYEPLPVTGYHVETGFLGGGTAPSPSPTTTTPTTNGPCTTSSDGHYAATSDRDAVAALRAAGLQRVRRGRGGLVSFAGDPAVARRALGSAGIDAPVRPDRVRRLHAVPNDASYAGQWALPAVRAAEAWDLGRGSRDVVVAVLDSGVDATHADLQGQLLPGYDATTSRALPYGNSDSAGHGTASTGVVAAATDNGAGLASLGWSTRVLPVKVEDAGGRILSSYLVNAIRYAADAGAAVINLSLGSCRPDAAEQDAVRYAQGKGVLVVASGGNEAMQGNPVNYPAAYPDVLAVGATGRDGTRAVYSNTGSFIDLVAPGGSGNQGSAHDVLMLRAGGGTFTAAGTSFSAPLVAAAAALVKAARPDLSGTALGAALTGTTRDLGPAGRDDAYGSGILDAAAALRAALPAAPATTAPTTDPAPTAPATTDPATTAPAGPSPATTAPASPTPDPTPSRAPEPTTAPPTTAPPTTAPPTTAPATTAPATTAPPTAAPRPVADAAVPGISTSTRTPAAGQSVAVVLRTTPGVRVDLYAASRPSTSFARIRTGTTDASGAVRFAVAPTTITRLYATATSASGRPVSSASVVLATTARTSLAAARTGALTYRFSGALAPARSGVVVTLYSRSSSGALTRLTTTRSGAGGRWALSRAFGRATTLTVVARTSADPVNAAGTSAPLRLAVR